MPAVWYQVDSGTEPLGEKESTPSYMETNLLVSRRRMIWDTGLNFMGLVIPLVIGLVALPFIVSGLGGERFGIFSFALAALGTFSLLDLGMPRATTKFLAERLVDGDMEKFTKAFWTSLLSQFSLGLASGGLLMLAIPVLTGGILNVPASLIGDTRLSLLLIALQVPFVMVTSGTRGALEAGQKFVITNALKIPFSSIMFVIPLVALHLGFGLVEILFSILVARVFMSCAHLLFCFKVYPALLRFATDARLIRPLLAFGGWVLVANMVSTALWSIDRLFIWTIQTTAAVGFYSVPVDALNRLFIVPTSLVTVLFPTFSAITHNDGQQLAHIFAQSVRFLMLLMAPPALFFAVFARPILGLWLGQEFVTHSTLVFQIVSVTVLINSLGWIPYALLQAIGRPDLPAKFMLGEVPLFIGLLWILIQRFGIAGAAIAWLIRSTAEVTWFLWALWRVRPDLFAGLLRSNSVGVFSAVLGLTIVSWLIISVLDNFVLAQVAAFFLALISFSCLCWSRFLERSERVFILSVMARPFNRQFRGVP